MAYTHLQFNDGTRHGLLLRSFLDGLEQTLIKGNAVLACMVTMIDGDASDAAQFTEVTRRFDFPDNATAKGAWDELNSVMAKLNGDGDVTFTNAAIKQVIAKLR